MTLDGFTRAPATQTYAKRRFQDTSVGGGLDETASAAGGTARPRTRDQWVFCHVNDRIRELAEAFELGNPLSMMCECSLTACFTLLCIDARHYDDVRVSTTRFFVAPGHERPELDRIVERGRGYSVVEEVPRPSGSRESSAADRVRR